MKARSAALLLSALALGVAGAVLAGVFVPRHGPAKPVAAARQETPAAPSQPAPGRMPAPQSPPIQPSIPSAPPTAPEAGGPSIQIDSPAEGTVYHSSLLLVGRVSDSPDSNTTQQLKSARWSIAGTDRAGQISLGTDGSFRVRVSTEGLRSSLALVVRVQDTHGGITEKSIGLVDDGRGPGVSVLSPASGSAYGSTVKVAGQVTGPKGVLKPLAEIASVSWIVNGTRLSGPLQVGQDGRFDFSFSTVGMRGSLAVTVTAKDRNGRVSLSVLKLADRVSGPALKIESPANMSVYSAAVSVVGSVGDPSDPSGLPGEVKSLSWRVIGRPSLAGNVSFQSNGSFSFSFPAEGLAGAQVLDLRATDRNDRSTSKAVTLLQAAATAEGTGTSAQRTAQAVPALSILSPADSSFYGANVAVTGRATNSATDAGADAIASVSWSLTGTSLSGTAAAGKDGGFSFSVRTLDLQGTQALSVKASRRDGGTTESMIVLLEKENGLPITVTAPADGGYYQDITVIEGKVGNTGSTADLMSFTYEVAGGISLTNRVVSDTDGTFKIPLSLSQATGDITVRLVAEDMNGHLSHAALYLRDGRLKPSITLRSPIKGGTYSSLIRVAGTVTDPYVGAPDMEGIASLSWLISPVDFSRASTPAKGAATLGPGGSFRFSLPTKTLSGPQDLTLTAAARSGNRTETTVRLAQGDADLSAFVVEPADRTLTVSWDAVPFAVRYDLSWGADGDAPEKGRTMSGVSSPVTLTGLENGTLYSVRVHVLFDDGGTGTSIVSRVIPLSPTTLAPLVTSGYLQIHLTWGRISGAGAYEVWRSVAGANDYKKIAASLSTPAYVDTTVEFGKGYSYEISPAGPIAPRSAPGSGRSLTFPKDRLAALATAAVREARRVTVSGGYAFIASGGGGVRIIDVSDPTSPTLVGEINSTDAWDVAVRGNRAFVADGESGLRVIDVSAPRAPVGIGLRKTLSARAVALSGNYAFVADGDKGLKVIDISDTQTLNRVAILDTENALGLAVSGNQLYLADGPGGLKILDISRPTALKVMGKLATTDARAVAVEGSIAVVADGAQGLRIIDVSNPSTPIQLATFDTGLSTSVALSERFAYVADRNSGIKVIDLKDPALPSLIATHATTGASGIAVEGRYAYIVDSAGLDLMRVQILGKSFQVASCETGGKAFSVSIQDNWAYVTGHTLGVQAVDVSDPARVNDASLHGGLFTRFAVDATVQDKLAYVADGSNGMRIIDVSPAWTGASKTQLVGVGAYRPGGTVSKVLAKGSFAYVAAGNQGLQVLDASTPSAPTEIGSVRTSDASDIVLLDTWAFIADGDAGIKVIDVSTPAQPKALPVSIRGNVKHLALTGTLLIAAGSSGVSILDVSDPKNPVFKGRYDTRAVEAITAAGKYVYVAEGYRGLSVLDISLPSRPVLVSTCENVFAVGVAVKGDYAFVADSFGLRVIQILIPDWLH